MSVLWWSLLVGVVQTVGLALLLGSYSLQLPCQVAIMIWPLPTPKLLSYEEYMVPLPGWFGS